MESATDDGCVELGEDSSSSALATRNRGQWPVRRQWHYHSDTITRRHNAVCDHDCHYARLADDRAIERPVDHCLGQTALEMVELSARIAQAGQFDDRRRSKPQPRPRRHIEQCQPARQHILADIARSEVEALAAQVIEQFGVDKVDLAQVGLARVDCDAGPVPDGGAGMGVSGNAETREQRDARRRRLGKFVLRCPGDSVDDGTIGKCHGSCPLRCPPHIGDERRQGCP